MELKEIMGVLQRPLTVDDIEFRASEVRGGWVRILAYKNARLDMRILDEATGGQWQNEYRRDSKGVLQCGIAIKIDGEWVWKWSNGIESNTEEEKGEYSDAFKRAGFMWGIGRELYDFPTLLAKAEADEVMEKDGKQRLTFKFKPNEWKWNIARLPDSRISEITAFQGDLQRVKSR